MKQIYLAPYSDEWPKMFEEEKAVLLSCIGKWVEDIQHIGSTAPIIDIMIGVTSLKDTDIYCVPSIQQLGYEYLPQYEVDAPGRRFFQKKTHEGVRTHHIHLVEINSDWWKRHILFRDYLLKHPEVTQEYEKLKKALAKSHSDTNEYALAKTNFIRSIEAKARNTFS